jgi:hypothetical protein
MKTFLTILTAVIVAVAVTLLIERHERKPASSMPGGIASQNSVQCGLDANGHIVPDGKGGCVSPPPDGYTIDVPKPDRAAVIFDMSSATPICNRAVGASKTGKCIDSDGSEVDRSEYDRRPTHIGDPVPFCDRGADRYGQCWSVNTKSIVNKNDYDRGREIR